MTRSRFQTVKEASAEIPIPAVTLDPRLNAVESHLLARLVAFANRV